MQPVDLMTVNEAAKLFHVSHDTFRTWMKRDQIPQNLFIRIGSTIRVKRKQLEEYINA